MNAVRNIILIPIVFVIIALVYTLIPLGIIGLMSLSKFWVIFLLIFFGGLIVVAFVFLPGAITWLASKISPNRTFAFYTIFIISLVLGLLTIEDFWTRPEFNENTLGLFFKIMLSCLTIGFATSFSVGAGIDLSEEPKPIFGFLTVAGSIVFYLGIFLAFCLLSNRICYINPEKTYTWYSGIWHGIFVIPNWVMTWFADDIYCKAPLRTAAYHVWWWISFIFIGLSVFGGGSNQRN